MLESYYTAANMNLTFALNSADSDGDVLSYQLLSLPAHGNLGTMVPSLTYTPFTNYNGPDWFSYQVYDGQYTSSVATIYIIVGNNPPTANPDVFGVWEDSLTNLLDVLANDTDVDNPFAPYNAGLTVTNVSACTNGGVVILTNGYVKYTPPANFYGTDGFAYTNKDTSNATAWAWVTVYVTNVNDAPSFSLSSNQVVMARNAGPVTVPNFMVSISAGPNESSQLLTNFVSTTNTAFFSTEPTIDASGALTFRVATDVVGTNYLTVFLQDNGGTDHGGVDTSGTQSFSIAVPDVTQPVIQFVSPTNTQLFVMSPTNILMVVTASENGLTITNVGFYVGNTSGSSSNSVGVSSIVSNLSTLRWIDATAGVYRLTARATNNNGQIGTAAITITLNDPPFITLLTPTNLSNPFLEITNVLLSALATNSDGSVTQVQFFTYANSAPSNLIGVAASNGLGNFSFTWSNLVSHPRLAGATSRVYSVVAIAKDDRGARTMSSLRSFKVCATNLPPTIVITSPADHTTNFVGIDVTLRASVTTGSTTNVEFFVSANGGSPESLGSDLDSPYSVTRCCWNAGEYTLIAKATDTNGMISLATNLLVILEESAKPKGFWDQEFGRQVPPDGSSSQAHAFDSNGIMYIALPDGTGTNIWKTTSVDGTNWTPFANYYFPAWHSLGIDETNIYGAGDKVIRWNGSAWEIVGTNTFLLGGVHEIEKVAFVGSDVYAAGGFTGMNNDSGIQYVAKLDRNLNAWVRVGNGLNGPVFDLAAVGDDLYIGGAFTDAGGNTNADYIARLVGNSWGNVGSGTSGTNEAGGVVTALAACGTNLIVGGYFCTVGGDTNAHGVAMWDGLRWHTLNGGIAAQPRPGYGAVYHYPDYDETAEPPFPRIYDLAVFRNHLFVVGGFTSALNGTNQIAASHVAMATWIEAEQTWSWTALDVGVFSPSPHDSYVRQCTVVEDPSASRYDLYVSGYFDQAGRHAVSSPGVARWHVGYPLPPAPPTVAITNPVARLMVTNGVNPLVTIAAIAESSYTNITGAVYFQIDGVRSDPDYTNISTTPAPDVYFTNLWANPPVGLHTVVAVATDDTGLVGASTPLIVNVKSTNHSITALDDQYSIEENSPAVTLNVLTNDTSTNAIKISQIVQITDSFGRVSIGHDQTYLTYTPLPHAYGADTFYYTVTNATGAQDSAAVTVRLLAHPEIAITSPRNRDRISTATAPITISGTTRDWDGYVADVKIYTNGVLYASGSTNSTGFTSSWTPPAPGYYSLVAIATDNDGITNASAPVTFAYYNAGAAAHYLTATIANLAVTNSSEHWLTSEQYPVIRDGIFDLRGQARDSAANAVSFQVQLVRPSDEDDTISDDLAIIAQSATPYADVTPAPLNALGFHLGGDTGGDLGNLDLTKVPNGVYDLLLTVRGGSEETSAVVRVRYESQLKIGQFSFSEQDLVIPVNGIPLTVIRTYNSMNPEVGDFGHSWTYALNSMDVKLDEQREDFTVGKSSVIDADIAEDANGLPRKVSLRMGGNRDVTLTLPDGRRTTFAFDPQYNADERRYYAMWKAPQGVNAKLSVLYGWDIINAPGFGMDPFWDKGDMGSTYENHDLPGWLLETQDGTKYVITRGLEPKDAFVSYQPDPSTNPIPVMAFGAPKLTQIVQRSGDVINISDTGISHYAGGTNLTRSLWFERDAAGRITAVHDPIGGSNGLPAVKYVYDRDKGNLLQVLKLVDRSAGTYITNKYHYDHPDFPHYITSIENAKGVPVTRNLYDESGRLIGMIDVSGHTNRFDHDIANKREVQYDRKGYSTVYTYDPQGNVTNILDALGHNSSFQYDDNGYLLATRDALGNTTTYTNDTDGNVLAVTLPYPAGSNAANYTTYFTWDSTGNQTSVRLPTGGAITNVYDASGNLTEVRDESGHLISSTAFGENGLAVSESDAFGSLSYAYDAMGNMKYMTNSLNHVTSSLYDPNGNLTNLVDNGVTTRVAYDALNRETFSDYGHDITVNYGHEADGDWSTVSGPTLGSMERHMDDQGRLAGWNTANGSTPGFAYDINGRLEYETNSLGVVTYHVYNPVGWLVAVTNLTTGAGTTYGYNAAGRKVAETNAYGQVTHFAYWPSGSLMAMTNATGTNYWLYSDAAGACASCGSAGTITDPLGRVTESVQSSHGLPLQAIRRSTNNAPGDECATNSTTYLSGLTTPEQEAEDYPATITDEGSRTRIYTYTALGQLLTATDLGGTNTWTNQYDADNGALTNVLSPTGETLTYAYDDLDNVKTIRFGDGNYLTNFYNDANRLSSNALPSGAKVQLEYDFAGRLMNRISSIGESAEFQYNNNDAVTIMTDNTGGTTNRYDAAGRFWGVDYPSGASVRYELDKLDRITAITNKASAGGTPYVTRYSYNALGSIDNITDPLNGQTVLEYDRVGRRTKRTLPNGVVTTWEYNWKDQVTNIVHKTGGGSTLASFSYVRNPGGEPSRITREDGSYVDLQYDPALRLTNENYFAAGGTPQTIISYAYDASGNRVRLVKGGTTLTNSVSPGYRITTVKDASTGSTAESYSYDNGGRVTSITRDSTTLNLGYNTADQVTAVTNGANWVTYVHDASGRRTISTNSSGVVRRLLVAATPGTGLESPLLIANGSGSMQQGYVFIGDQPLLRFDADGNPVYYLEDAMGSIATLVSNNVSIAAFNYDGFGNTRSISGSSTNAPDAVGGDFRFHGAWLEEGTGLYNMRARDYDSRVGRFTSRDPQKGSFKLVQTINPYCFAINNPWAFSDRSGEFTVVEINVTGALETSLQAFRTAAIERGKGYITEKIVDAFSKAAIRSLSAIFPGVGDLFSVFEGGSTSVKGSRFGAHVVGRFCEAVNDRAGHILEYVYIEPGIDPEKGDAIFSGIHCPFGGVPHEENTVYPDFIIGDTDPRQNGTTSWFVGEVKISGNSLYNQYYLTRKDPNGKFQQFRGMVNFASRHSHSRMVIFITFYSGEKSNLKKVGRLLGKKGVEKGVLAFIFAASKNKGF